MQFQFMISLIVLSLAIDILNSLVGSNIVCQIQQLLFNALLTITKKRPVMGFSASVSCSLASSTL